MIRFKGVEVTAMETDERIKRFFAPTLSDLAPLKESLRVDDETLEKVRAVLAGEVDPREVSPKADAWYRSCYHAPRVDGHELALCACDDLLGTHGVEALSIEDAPHYTDEGIRMCPPFSYCNAGDTYVVTLARDHKAGAWVVACWGDLAQEYEQEEEIGDYEIFDACPDACPCCDKRGFSLEFFPGSGRGPSYSWVCDYCNHHCFATSDEQEHSIQIGEDEDCHEVRVKAIPPVEPGQQGRTLWRYIVTVGEVPWHGGRQYNSAQEAREAWDAAKEDERP